MIKISLTRCVSGITTAFKYPQYIKKAMFLPAMDIRSFSNKPKLSYNINRLTKSLTMLSNSDVKFKLENSKEIADIGQSKSLKLVSHPESNQQPTVIMFPWLMAQPKHYHKYAELYLQLGFDVLTVSFVAKDIMWPVKGSQVVSKDLLSFLEINRQLLGPLMIHGLSSGGYIWGEALTQVNKDRERYSDIINSISGHIWECYADLGDIYNGMTHAVFPKSPVMRKAFRSYLELHMKVFHNSVTQHYIRACENFHTSNCSSPGLLLVSRKDPIGTVYTSTKVKESWDSLGKPSHIKIWDDAAHVGIYRRYPEEYVAEIAAFLSRIELLPTAINKIKVSA